MNVKITGDSNVLALVTFITVERRRLKIIAQHLASSFFWQHRKEEKHFDTEI